MLLSRDGKSSVRSSKLRSFAVQEWNTFDGNKFRLIGMFNNKDSFEFGVFDTEGEALTFLLLIHEKIEGGK